MSFKRAKVVMLPTNEKAPIAKYNNILYNAGKNKDYSECIFQHLYIISDDEIREGDYWLNLDDNSVNSGINWKLANNTPSCKKIIATTDRLVIDCEHLPCELYPKGLFKVIPQPSQSFIEKYVEKRNKGNIINDVLVEYEPKLQKLATGEIVIGSSNDYNLQLKINPKDNTITIKKIKDSLKDIMNNNPEIREEVKQLLEVFGDFVWQNESNYSDKLRNKWIEENL